MPRGENRTVSRSSGIFKADANRASRDFHTEKPSPLTMIRLLLAAGMGAALAVTSGPDNSLQRASGLVMGLGVRLAKIGHCYLLRRSQQGVRSEAPRRDITQPATAYWGHAQAPRTEKVVFSSRAGSPPVSPGRRRRPRDKASMSTEPDGAGGERVRPNRWRGITDPRFQAIFIVIAGVSGAARFSQA